MLARLVLAPALLGLLAACSASHFEGSAVVPPSAAPAFTLTDQTGKLWNLADQRGKTVALFFGYTHCPDTCPATLAKLANAVRDAKAGDKAVIAFVTVDPERDTPTVLGAFVKKFNGPIVALTGTRAQIEATERSYHQWAQKIPGKHGNDDYDDSHSATIFLIDRTGNERVIHDPDDTVGSIATDIRTLNA
jgi:protein SCO1/2